MLRGLHLAATGMVAQQMRQEVISHNLANASTAGFKAETVPQRSFPELLLARMEAGVPNTPVGPFSPGVLVDELVTDFSPGPLEETGRPTDLALVDRPGSPPAFFAVLVEGETRYTRNGNFTLGPAGELQTHDGYPVLGEQGPVVVGQEGWYVDSQGGVWVGGTLVDRLLLVTFDDPHQLEREEGLLFVAPPGLLPQAAATEVKQGFLEKANLNAVNEIVNMLAALRAYEAGQKVIQVQDELLGKCVNEIGSLR
ncbi:MAG: flagellar hook-basal body protein [Thermoanaerobacteraceae bacterium]|nr:flagellar hook-basal body protein [Thermoanaerobacteraceae bacterium]